MWRNELLNGGLRSHSAFLVVLMLHIPVIPVDSRTRWWWTASSQECWGSTRRLSLRGKDENELGINSQITGDFLRLITHFFQGLWARWFPECSVWRNEAPPHVSARWVSVKHPQQHKTHPYILPVCSSNKENAVNKIQETPFFFFLQLQCVYHGIRADRKWKDSHHDRIPAAGGVHRDAAGDAAGNHP